MMKCEVDVHKKSAVEKNRHLTLEILKHTKKTI